MRHALPVLSLIGACMAGAALAGAIVIGRGVGRECYEATLSRPSPAGDAVALAACNRAVDDLTADAHGRAAALVNRADILLRMQRFPEAVADSDKGIALNPDLGVAYLNRGAGMVGLQRYDEALAALNRALDLGVDKPHLAYFDRGMAKEYLGDIRGAYLDYRKAVELDPSFQLASDQLSRFTVAPQQRP